jgi:glycosyltransferase involved in cell wall biosynthesis
MRVLLANNLYGAGSRGGAESVVRAEAEALAGLGHEVSVVSLGDGSSSDGKIREISYRPPNLFDYRELPGHGFGARLAWHFLDIFNVGSAREFGRIVDEFGPDVVHTHNLMGLGFMIPAELRLHRARHVHTVHDVQLLHPSGLLPVGHGGGLPKLSVAARTYIRLMRRLMGSPDAVVFPSEFMMKLHRRFGFFPKSKCEVVRNPAPPPIGRREPPAKPRFLFAGQLEKHKGIGTLIGAWEGEAGKPAGAELVICGGGSLDERIRKAAGANHDIHYLGKLDREKLLDEIGRSSFVIVPSEVIENAPSIIMESFSRGTPVIAAKSGGIPELVREGETGFLFEAGNVEALAASLRRAAELSAEKWETMSVECLKLSGDCAVHKWAERLLGLF